jgi:nitrogen fixation NifU-like protein
MISERIVEILKSPKNMGKIENPDGIGKVENPLCEDEVWIFIRVENDKIIDAKFEAFACTPAIVTSSIATELAKGKTIKEALKITKDDVVAEIGGLPPIKKHCSDLGTDGLKAAIEDYLSKKE